MYDFCSVGGIDYKIMIMITRRSSMPDPKTYKQHFESKHSKAPMPAELVDVKA